MQQTGAQQFQTKLRRAVAAVCRACNVAREEGGSKRFWLSGVTMGRAWQQALAAPKPEEGAAAGSADALERLCSSLGCSTVRAFVIVHTYVEAQDTIEAASGAEAGVVGAAATLDRRLEEHAARVGLGEQGVEGSPGGSTRPTPLRTTVPLGTGWALDGLERTTPAAAAVDATVDATADATAGDAGAGAVPSEGRQPGSRGAGKISAADGSAGASVPVDDEGVAGGPFEYEYRWVVARRVRVSARTEVPPAVLLGLAARDEERRSRRSSGSSSSKAASAEEGAGVDTGVVAAAGAGV